MDYTPSYPPSLNQKTLNLSNIRFGITHANTLVDPKDSNIESTHIHDYPEFFFNISSDVSFLVDNRLYPVEKGEVIFSRANDVHFCVYNSKQYHEYYCLWLDADKDTLAKILPSSKSHPPLFSFNESKKNSIRSLLERLYLLCQTKNNEFEKTVCLLRLLSLFENSDSSQEIDDTIPQPLQKIIDDIHLNFAQIEHVNDLLKRHFVSPATLNRWFKKYIRISPREFLESKKLAHAAQLLVNGETVTEACFQSGFSDCSHFIVLFKKKFSETPLKYKQRFS